MAEPAYLTRIDPVQNMARYYRMDVQPDPFGGWSLIREWGRIGQSGQVRISGYCSSDQAFEALARYQRAKNLRGYQREDFKAKECPRGRGY